MFVNSGEQGFSFIKVLVIIVIVVLLAGVGLFIYKRNHKSTTTAMPLAGAPAGSFNFGFDFSDQEPDPTTQDPMDANNVPSAVASAKQVMRQFAGSIFDQSIDGFGVADPEPTAGSYDLSSLNARINLITSEGGVPVITLVGAPSWMYSSVCNPNPSNGFFTPPCPAYYQDFAALAAHIAVVYPQVKDFIVWNEFKGFYTKSKSIDYTDYTTMYNDVYNAIKKARPDAMVGGPYAPMSAFPCAEVGHYSQTLRGSWGCISQNVQTAFSYWLANKVGADFIAVDGTTEIAKANDASLTDDVTASEKYAAVDDWIRSQTTLPIWWMESHIAPHKGWSFPEGAAARIATLILMNSSGASVGIQWQPQEQTENLSGKDVVWPDEGLWTTTEVDGGGQPTPLATELLEAETVLRKPLTVVAGEPVGVIVATSGNSSILVNTNGDSVTATLKGDNVRLPAYNVTVNQ